MKKVEVFWSGGYDSTFMVVNYLMQGYTVKPYYILFDKAWHENEMKAIANIKEALSKYPQIKGKLLSVTVVDKSLLNITPAILKSFNLFKGEPYFAPEQYMYFAAFANEHPGVAIGQERYYEKPGHMTRLFYEKGHFTLDKNNVGHFNIKTCHPAVYALFGKSIYPITLYNNRMMMDKLKEWGLEEIAFLTLSCHYPINGKPCGVCDPCLTKMRQHMDELLPEEARKNVFTYNYLDSLGKTYQGKNWSLWFRFYILDRATPEGADRIVSKRLASKEIDEMYRFFEKVLENPPKIYDNRP